MRKNHTGGRFGCGGQNKVPLPPAVHKLIPGTCEYITYTVKETW